MAARDTGLTDDELARARAELHAHYQRRFGRVELRGFLDADGGSVSFALDDLFQPLDALEIDDNGAATPVSHPIGGARVIEVGVNADGGDTVRLLAAPAPLLGLLERPRARISLILGAPGAGKSFFLRWCAIYGSSDEAFLGLDRPLPLHVSLATLRANALPDLAAHALDGLRDAGLAIADAIETEAVAGRVLFLLDGLDETGAAVPTIALAIADLARTYPLARILITSRPSVVAIDRIELAADRYQLEGLDDDAITAVLTRWCELHAVHRGGADAAARGSADGARLARKVLTTAGLHDLASTPLYASFIAILHRAGVAPPDHRIELCDRIAELLVARANEVRSRDWMLPITAADLFGLLGPIALTLIETGADGAVDEAVLRRHLSRELARGAVPGLTEVDDAMGLLRDTLGLVVEHRPGVLGFAHRTLLDVLAAHELVRTDALEMLIASPTCFAAAWHEVIRLALAVVGTLRNQDQRLDAAVRALVERAHESRSAPTVLVPDLLGAILVDDPGLTAPLATALCEELVPAWWFDGTPAIRGEYAGIALADRVLNGPWQRELARVFIERYRPGWGEVRYGSGGLRSRLSPMGILRRLGCSVPLLLCEALVAEMVAARDDDPADEAAQRFTPLTMITPPVDGSPWAFVGFALRSAGLSALLRKGAGGLFFAAMASDSEVGPSWTILEDTTGQRMIGRRLDAARDDGRIDMTGALHIAVLERPDPSLLPNVLAAWRELAARYPDGPRPPESIDDAVARYGSSASIN